MAFTLGMTVDVYMTNMLMLVSMMQGHSGSAKAKQSALNYLDCVTTNQAPSIILATTVGHFLRDLDFENVYMV